jgi:hypothetical protein
MNGELISNLLNVCRFKMHEALNFTSPTLRAILAILNRQLSG